MYTRMFLFDFVKIYDEINNDKSHPISSHVRKQVS